MISHSITGPPPTATRSPSSWKSGLPRMRCRRAVGPTCRVPQQPSRPSWIPNRQTAGADPDPRSGAILLWLKETGRFLSPDPRNGSTPTVAVLADGRAGPDSQPRTITSACAGRPFTIDRYVRRRAGSTRCSTNGSQIALHRRHDDYSIADVACYPWIVPTSGSARTWPTFRDPGPLVRGHPPASRPP